MEALEMKEKLNIKTAEKSLFNKWVEECLLLNNPVPCVNKESFKHMLDDCKEDSEPIVFISIGCQQFATVSDNNGDSLDIVTNLSTHAGSRADKWSKGIASMQKALTSFGITNTLFLTLSNVERIVL
ncbi:MAG TPA: hypothetical protein VHA74_00120, partial [Candidatus Dojkabacteria bacterium]|nr:hypothetical protein [Candidatus Dojkabacteria bacterium]